MCNELKDLWQLWFAAAQRSSNLYILHAQGRLRLFDQVTGTTLVLHYIRANVIAPGLYYSEMTLICSKVATPYDAPPPSLNVSSSEVNL
jgi:hypothetical protein